MLVAAGALFLSGSLAAGAARVWITERLAASRDPQDWERAATLEPENAARWLQLARARQWDLERPDLPQVIASYRRAADLNPRSAVAWTELAGAYEQFSDFTGARDAFARARNAAPLSPQVSWRFGNFLLRQGDLRGALRELRRALAADPTLTEAGVALVWPLTQDPQVLLNELLPPDARALDAGVNYLVSRRQLDAALALWKPLCDLQPRRSPASGLALTERLLEVRRTDEARAVWDAWLAASGWSRSEPASGSLLTDGGFEHALPGAGLGWRWVDAPQATLAFDTATRRSGVRAVHIRFEGTAPLGFHHLAQYVVVEPRRRYRFTAFVRAEGVTPPTGLRFRLQDPDSPSEINVLTSPIVGTAPWTPVEVDLLTSPRTRLLTLTVVRLPAHGPNHKLGGAVWLDDVSLVPLEAEAAR